MSLTENLQVQWEIAKEDGSKEVIDPSAIRQKFAPVIRNSEEIAKTFAELEHRKGRSCGNCRYFSPPEDPSVQAILVKTHALDIIEKEAEIPSRYALPLMQGICHLDSKLSAVGGALSFTPAGNFCDNHAPKNSIRSFLKMFR